MFLLPSTELFLPRKPKILMSSVFFVFGALQAQKSFNREIRKKKTSPDKIQLYRN